MKNLRFLSSLVISLSSLLPTASHRIMYLSGLENDNLSVNPEHYVLANVLGEEVLIIRNQGRPASKLFIFSLNGKLKSTIEMPNREHIANFAYLSKHEVIAATVSTTTNWSVYFFENNGPFIGKGFWRDTNPENSIYFRQLISSSNEKIYVNLWNTKDYAKSLKRPAGWIPPPMLQEVELFINSLSVEITPIGPRFSNQYISKDPNQDNFTLRWIIEDEDNKTLRIIDQLDPTVWIHPLKDLDIQNKFGQINKEGNHTKKGITHLTGVYAIEKSLIISYINTADKILQIEIKDNNFVTYWHNSYDSDYCHLAGLTQRKNSYDLVIVERKKKRIRFVATETIQQNSFNHPNTSNHE